MKRIALMFLLCVCQSVAAVTTEVKNGELTIGGTMVPGDLEKIQKIFAENKIEEVHFDNCMGGDVATGYQLSKIIRQRGLKTVARHQAGSSCAYAYLAGTPRVFSRDLGAHVIMLHAARNVDPKNDVASKFNPILRRYLSNLTEGKLTGSVADLIERSNQPTQGVVFVSFRLPFFSINRVFYCNGSEGGELGKCLMLREADALMLGIITSK